MEIVSDKIDLEQCILVWARTENGLLLLVGYRSWKVIRYRNIWWLIVLLKIVLDFLNVFAGYVWLLGLCQQSVCASCARRVDVCQNGPKIKSDQILLNICKFPSPLPPISLSQWFLGIFLNTHCAPISSIQFLEMLTEPSDILLPCLTFAITRSIYLE